MIKRRTNGVRSDVLIIAGNARSVIANRGNLIGDLRARGLHVAVAVPRADYLAEVEGLDVSVHLVDMSRGSTNPLKDLRYAASLVRLISRVRPKVVLSYTVKPVIYGSLAARACRVPGRFALVTGLGHVYTSATPKVRVLRMFTDRLYRIALAGCHKVFFQNPDDVAEFVDRKILPDSRRAVVVNGSGVDTSVYESSELPLSEIVFLFVGRLLSEKGIKEFVEAASALKRDWPGVQFQAIGPHDPTLPHAVTESELNSWKATGVVDFVGGVDDVRPWLKACTVFVLPSYREGTPRSVLEALSVGRPIITSDAPGCRETVIDGVNGFLARPRDSNDLRSKMERMLRDPQRMLRMAEASRALALSKYDVRKVNAAMLETMEL